MDDYYRQEAGAGGTVWVGSEPVNRHLVRTRANVYNADGTVIFSQTPELTGGTKRTVQFAEEYGRPYHVVGGTSPKARAAFVKWLEDEGIRTLNVAGSRQWKQAGELRGKEDFQDRVCSSLLMR